MVRDRRLLNFIFFILLAFFIFNPILATAQEVQVNKEALDFSLESLEGKEVVLGDYAGRPVLLFFWATWCYHCREVIPQLKKLKEEFGKQGLEILAINFQESRNSLKRFTKRYNIKHQVLLDKTGDVFKRYGVYGVPTVIVVDGEGVVRYRSFGLPSDLAEILE